MSNCRTCVPTLIGCFIIQKKTNVSHKGDNVAVNEPPTFEASADCPASLLCNRSSENLMWARPKAYAQVPFAAPWQK